MTEPERLDFEREARETILCLALKEALILYGTAMDGQATETLFRLEHGFVSSIREAEAPDHLAAAASSAAEDAIALIRRAFDGAHRRFEAEIEQAEIGQAASQAA